MIRFVGSIDGATQLDRGFNRIEQAISDFRPIWGNVAREFYQIEVEQFESQGAKGASGRWAPLSKVYAEYKARVFPGKSILQAVGMLFESMTSFEGGDSIFRPEPQELTIGSRHPAARAHQRGTKKMPARPVISLKDEHKRRLTKAIQAGLVQFTRKLGFEVGENAS